MFQTHLLIHKLFQILFLSISHPNQKAFFLEINLVENMNNQLKYNFLLISITFLTTTLSEEKKSAKNDEFFLPVTNFFAYHFFTDDYFYQ